MELRAVADSEFNGFLTSLRRVFGVPAATDEELQLLRGVAELGRTLAVFEVGQVVATAAAWSFKITVPGAELPAAGVTWVSVMPTHRRRGMLRGMMRKQLDDAHELGEPLAALYASEGPIYGRFGYGMATLHAEVAVPSGQAFRSSEPTNGVMELVDSERARGIFDQVAEKIRPDQPGMVRVPPQLWRLRLADIEHWRRGASAQYLLVYEVKGKPEGIASYRLRPTWSDGRPDTTMVVRDLLASTPDAYAAVWRYLLDVDLVRRVEAEARPMYEPLRYLLEDPRAMTLRVHDGLWLRLVDVKKALAGRRYAVAGRLAVEVRDEFCEWNAGRYLLDGAPEGAACRSSKGAPDLVLDVRDLAAAYLGGTTFRALHRAGRVEEATSGALLRADQMFASDPPPWCPTHF
jgi:predicted acetyltransferase